MRHRRTYRVRLSSQFETGTSVVTGQPLKIGAESTIIRSIYSLFSPVANRTYDVELWLQDLLADFGHELMIVSNQNAGWARWHDVLRYAENVVMFS